MLGFASLTPTYALRSRRIGGISFNLISHFIIVKRHHVHPKSKEELIAELRQMREVGTTLSMLVMTVKTTSHGMLAGVVDGDLKLDYPRAGWLDIVSPYRFLSFCHRHNLSVTKERWGKERIYRTSIGTDPITASSIIDKCFEQVFHHSGSYGLELRYFGWQSSN